MLLLRRDETSLERVQIMGHARRVSGVMPREISHGSTRNFLKSWPENPHHTTRSPKFTLNIKKKMVKLLFWFGGGVEGG